MFLHYFSKLLIVSMLTLVFTIPAYTLVQMTPAYYYVNERFSAGLLLGGIGMHVWHNSKLTIGDETY